MVYNLPKVKQYVNAILAPVLRALKLRYDKKYKELEVRISELEARIEALENR